MLKILLLLGLAAAFGDQPRHRVDTYSWHAAGEDQIQFGLPDTDERVVSLGCSETGQLWVSVGANASLTAHINGLPYQGHLEMRGDGENLVIDLAADSAPVERLLEGRGIVVSILDVGWSAPGGAQDLMRDLLATCAARH